MSKKMARQSVKMPYQPKHVTPQQIKTAMEDEAAAEKRELARRAQREKRRQAKLDKLVSPPQHDAAPDAPSRSQPDPRFELKPPRPGSFWYPLYKWWGGM